MTVVYFGLELSGDAKHRNIRNALKLAGVHLVRAAPSAIAMGFIPFDTFPLFAVFIACLSAIIFSVATKKATLATIGNMTLTESHHDRFPFHLPALCVLATRVSTELREKLDTDGFYDSDIRGRIYLIHDSPTPDTLRLITSADPSLNKFEWKNWVPERHVNLEGMFALSELLHLLSFTSSVLNHAVHQKDKPLLKDFTPATEAATGSDGGTMRPSSLRRTFWNPIEIIQGSPSNLTVGNPHSGDAWYSQDRVSTSDKSGLCFNYVPALTRNDLETVPCFVQRYLMKSLGKNHSTQIAAFQALRINWGVLATTPVGNALSHMVKCMELSITGQCSVYPIFSSGYYEGCIMYGTGTFFIIDRMFSTVSGEEFANDLKEMSSHNSAVRTIKELTGWKSMPDHEDALTKEAFDSMYDLRCFVLSLELPQNVMKKVKEAARDLQFEQPHWTINASSLKMFFDLLLGTEEFSPRTPISAEALDSSDTMRVALSCFGTSCPRFSHPAGTFVSLDSHNPPVAPLPVKRGGAPVERNNAPWTITVTRCDLDAAVVSLRTVIKDKGYKSITTATGSGMGGFILRGKKFIDVWRMLKKVSLLSVESDKETSERNVHGKRARRDADDSEDDEEGGVSLAKKFRF